MVYLVKDTENRLDDQSQIIYHFTQHLIKLVGHISDRVFVVPVDIGGTLLVDIQPYGCFVFFFTTLLYALLWANKILNIV